MRYIFLIMLIIFTSCKLSSQYDNGQCKFYYYENLKKKIYITADEHPTYKDKDGEKSLLPYILTNLKIDEDDELQFKVLFSFIVDSNGKVIEAKIEKKEESQYTSIEKKIIELLNKMEKWKPAICCDKAIPFLYKFPLRLDYR